MGEIYSDARPPRSKSFFLYLLDRGVSVEEYRRKLDEFLLFPRVTYVEKMDACKQIWPDEWAAYVAVCRISGTSPH